MALGFGYIITIVKSPYTSIFYLLKGDYIFRFPKPGFPAFTASLSGVSLCDDEQQKEGPYNRRFFDDSILANSANRKPSAGIVTNRLYLLSRFVYAPVG